MGRRSCRTHGHGDWGIRGLGPIRQPQTYRHMARVYFMTGCMRVLALDLVRDCLTYADFRGYI